VRSGAALAAEDEPDNTGRLRSRFLTIWRMAIGRSRATPDASRLDLLAFSARLITLEQAIRFLGDYLNRDIYYKGAPAGSQPGPRPHTIGMLRDMGNPLRRHARP